MFIMQTIAADRSLDDQFAPIIITEYGAVFVEEISCFKLLDNSPSQNPCQSTPFDKVDKLGVDLF